MVHNIICVHYTDAGLWTPEHHASLKALNISESWPFIIKVLWDGFPQDFVTWLNFNPSCNTISEISEALISGDKTKLAVMVFNGLKS